jgi:hypothetical protein
LIMVNRTDRCLTPSSFMGDPDLSYSTWMMVFLIKLASGVPYS